MEPGPREEAASRGEVAPALEALPGLARIAAGAWYRTAAWSVGAALHTAERIGTAAVSGGSPVRVAEDLGTDALAGLRQVLRDVEGADQPAPGQEGGAAPSHEQHARVNGRRAGRHGPSLRERGAELLDRAADVSDPEDPVHPGFVRIIDQLAPDEARILKLLVNEGPQGIVYVNRSAPFGIGAREIARRLSMIGAEAGCLHGDLVPAYLDNLVSHGLVAIRRDALEDETPYQVIEAQPEVIGAMEEADGRVFRGHVTRRSVHLTDFGRAFCIACFPPEHLTGADTSVAPAMTPVAQ